MALLPNRNLFDGTKSPKPTTAEMKSAWATMRDYMAALLGVDSDDKPGARAALGVSSAEDVQAGKSIFAVATGTGDAMVVALSPTLLALVDGMELHVRCPASNGTTAPTLKVDALDPQPIVGSDGNPLAVNAYLANWPAIFRYRKSLGSAPAAFELLNPAPVIAGAASSVRQTVLAGAVDASGYANMLSAGSGLSLSLAAAATPMVLSFAGGYDAAGEVNYLTRLTANVASVVSGLAASNVSYILADYVSATAVAWGKTLAPPQYGRAYNQAAQALLHFNGTAGATTILDDFGNTWSAQGGAKLQSNQSKFGGTALGGAGTNNALNGSTDYVRTTSISTLNTIGSDSWTMRGHFYFTTFGASSRALLGATNASGYGIQLFGTTGGKLNWQLSGNGTSLDIASATGTTTMATNTWHFVEIGYDAIAGQYFANLNGARELTQASGARICPITELRVGGANNAGSSVGFDGYIDEFEFLPYCDHPNGTTYSVPTAAPSITAAGYASDYFSIPNMTMYGISAASSAPGVNPTFTAKSRVYVGECLTGASSVSNVINYAINGRYDSGIFAAAANTSYARSHNIGTRMFNLDVTTADDVLGNNERPAQSIFYATASYYGIAATFSSRVSSTINVTPGGLGVTAPIGGQPIASGFLRMRARRTF